ncbi:MAG: DUF3267 domain-containing protein [Verrucomicrobia bacterium]|nr:DUF3267 domain-containing protein [Verrucomicrobiota bacterium]
MQIHWGAIPAAVDFQPEAEGWNPIREPSPVLMQFIALPLGVVMVGLLVTVLHFIAPRGLCGNGTIVIPPSEVSVAFAGALIVLVLLIPVHEMIHALIHPAQGRTDKTMIGIWPSRLLFYAHYEGVLSRGRFLAVFAAPFIVLSLCPIPLIALMSAWGKCSAIEMCLTALSLINGLSSAGDALGMMLIASQVPTTANVRNRGWRTYWKMPAIESR